jgi:hypothetical protein
MKKNETTKREKALKVPERLDEKNLQCVNTGAACACGCNSLAPCAC